VILLLLQRAQERMRKCEHPGRLYPDHAKRFLSSYRSYFSSVRPAPFLPDITTKNILVHQGQLSGIVDVDQICFGDPLLTIGLTRMALLAGSFDLDYIEYWMNLLKLDRQQERIVNAYTLLFCVDFMSELGEQFNRTAVKSIDSTRYAHLESIFERLASSAQD
jgi:hypothetical protein